MFRDILYYKPNLYEVIERYKRLYAAQGPGHICIYATPPFEAPKKTPPLTEVNLDEGLEDYLDLCLRNYEAMLEVTRAIPDDLIPSFGLFFGIGDYSAFIAGEVIFTPDTSWAAPVLRDWADLDELALREDNYWVRLLERAVRYAVERMRSGPIPLVRGYYSPLDLAHALRGERLFTDFFDAPEQVHRLMAFCTKATIWIAKRLQALIGYYWGGSIAGAWLPAGTICMSEDIACMVSPHIYAQFARPYTQQVIDAFGHGQIHTHSLGMHVLPEITQLRNLVGVQVSDDPNTPRPFDHLDTLLPKTHNVPLSIGCTGQDVRQHIEKLARSTNIILASNVTSVEEGIEVVELVRRFSA